MVNIKEVGVCYMSVTRKICFWAICSLSCMAAVNAHAAKVSYTLDNILLDNDTQITGAFDWTYDVGDFEGGAGVFTALEIPGFRGQGFRGQFTEFTVFAPEVLAN